MKLDSRIIEGKKPLDCFDTEIAKQFIGKKGYFSHYIDNYADLENTVLGTLGDTGDTFHESFVCTEETFDNYYYEFFIPEEWVNHEEPEKKYRPYTLAEWIEQHEIGNVINFRSKDTGTLLTAMYLGYGIAKDKSMQEVNSGTIMLGICSYSFDYLLENCEICINGTWQPFGVIDE